MQILTVKQVSEMLQVKPSTLYAWAEQGKIPSLKMNGLLRFEESEIVLWVKGCKKQDRCYTALIHARARKGG